VDFSGFYMEAFLMILQRRQLPVFALATVLAASAAQADPKPPASDRYAIVELRQYTLRPGQRDVLITLFDREFVETQEATGMRIYGQFRDGDNRDRFVWIRGFTDMETRARALTAFYSGPVWKTHGRAAASTMIDSDNVLLLHPVDHADGFDLQPAARPAVGSPPPASLVVATIYDLRDGTTREFPAFFRETLLPLLRDAGTAPRAAFESEHAKNTYPALPVREGEDVFVWFASFASPAAYVAATERLSQSSAWANAESELKTYLESSPQHLRLRPTGRSLLR
jgi:quinol monooxygenase YgiN